MQKNTTPGRKGKIAVIDDDGLIRYLLDLHLRAAGYEVFTAEDAVAGARLVVERTPDMILCDIDMPYMDGYEFVAALRADPATRDIPVIFLTVNARLDERALPLRVGHLVKPVTTVELLRAVRSVVPTSPD
ncbi:MAG TPA: response regulator [Burkholderiales bacterium]|nr:response regulator [Burkholderiales bacterium]